MEGLKKVYTCLCYNKLFRGGGISRMKRHLTGLPGDITRCLEVPNEVREEILKILNEFEQNNKVLTTQKRSFSEMDGQSSRDNVASSKQGSSTVNANYSSPGDSSLAVINTHKVKPSDPFNMQHDLKSVVAGKDAAMKADKDVARRFYE
ncbi:hypothetical protein LINGRAHAP2_LOCUS23839 [Linum grandiflorum]